MDARTIEVNDVAGVPHVTIIPKPGVSLICGPNDSGKSLLVEGLKVWAGGRSDAELTCSDGTLSGSIEGLGRTVRFKRSARASGDLEARTLEDRFSIADLVDPKLKNPEAADRARIKALLQLTGVGADAKRFRSLFPDGESFNAACTADVIKCDDAVEMAAKLRRNIQEHARSQENAAEKADGLALGCKPPDGLDMSIETNDDILQAALEDALAEQGNLLGQKNTASSVRASAASALEKTTHATPPDVRKAEIVRTEAQVALNGAQDEVDRLEKELASARSELQTAKSAFAEADHALSQEKAHAETWASWEEAIKSAKNVACPSEEAIAAAQAKVQQCRKNIGDAAVVRAAQQKMLDAETHRKTARECRKKAEQLREAAKGTDEILSRMVASDNVKVKDGRLVTQHPERGEVYFSVRSTGTRWMMALDEAVKRVVQLDSDNIPIVLVPQECWGELDPTNRRAIHLHAIERGVMVIGIEATDGEIRAEAFDAEN
jgi:hypothetical protein